MLVGRALRLHCLVCGRGRPFIGPLRMRETCEACGYRFARESGYFIGSAYINAIFTLATSRAFSITSGYYNLVQGQYSTVYYNGTDYDFAAKVVKGNGTVYAITPGNTATCPGCANEKALFSYPGAGDAGGVPFRAFHGPLYTNIDTSMFKNFRVRFLGEQGNVQFRAEAFNLLNHPSFSNPNGQLNSSSFGVITSTQSTARVLQFALKVNF